MMCNEALDKMGYYIDQQLTDDERIEFENHMRECKSCREQFEEFEKLLLKVKNIEDVEPPFDLKDKIMNTIKTDDILKNKTAKVFNFKKYSTFAAVFLVFFCATYVLRLNYLREQQNHNNNLGAANLGVESTTEHKTEIQTDDKNQSETENYTENTTDDKAKDDLAVASIDDPSNPNLRGIPEGETENGIYFYEQTITSQDKKLFLPHSIFLNDTSTCNVFFENTSNEDASIIFENSAGEMVGQEYIILKNTSKTINFSPSEYETQEDFYSVVLNSKGNNYLSGYLKIEY